MQNNALVFFNTGAGTHFNVECRVLSAIDLSMCNRILAPTSIVEIVLRSSREPPILNATTAHNNVNAYESYTHAEKMRMGHADSIDFMAVSSPTDVSGM